MSLALVRCQGLPLVSFVILLLAQTAAIGLGLPLFCISPFLDIPIKTFVLWGYLSHKKVLSVPTNPFFKNLLLLGGQALPEIIPQRLA